MMCKLFVAIVLLLLNRYFVVNMCDLMGFITKRPKITCV